jgi:plastocyanin
MTVRTAFVVAAAATVAAATASAAPAATPTVNGTVGPGFTIGLTQAGKKVTALHAGKVTFVVNDKASIHNFEVSGPKGFSKKLTDVGFVGKKAVTLTLPPGTYTFYCKPHKSSMNGTFKVS